MRLFCVVLLKSPFFLTFCIPGCYFRMLAVIFNSSVHRVNALTIPCQLGEIDVVSPKMAGKFITYHTPYFSIIISQQFCTSANLGKDRIRLVCITVVLSPCSLAMWYCRRRNAVGRKNHVSLCWGRFQSYPMLSMWSVGQIRVQPQLFLFILFILFFIAMFHLKPGTLLFELLPAHSTSFSTVKHKITSDFIACD